MININVGGKFFCSNKETLLASCFFKLYFDDNPSSKYIFVDRDSKFFHIILNHLRGYTVSLPCNEEDLYIIYEDSQYYGLTTLIKKLEKILLIKFEKKELCFIKKQINSYSNTCKINVDIKNLSGKQLFILMKNLESKVQNIQKNEQLVILIDTFFDLLNLKYKNNELVLYFLKNKQIILNFIENINF